MQYVENYVEIKKNLKKRKKEDMDQLLSYIFLFANLQLWHH